MATENYSDSKLGDDDLLLQVLIRLPDPKSTFRCKSVCKRWNSLVSTPYFLRCFVSHHQTLSAAAPEPPLLIPSSDSQKSICSFVPMPSDEIRSRSLVLDCFNDLLLLGFERGDSYGDELDRTLFVCNPFTKQWVSLPLAPLRPMIEHRSTKLACEPRRSVSLDLGESKEKDFVDYRFRVVRMHQDLMDVFCSESGEWIVKGGVYPLGSPYWGIEKVTASHNGKLCWKNRLGQFVKWNPFRPLDNTTFNDAGELNSFYCSIWISQGALHMISHPKVFGKLRDGFSVWRWEEEEDYRGWRKLYDMLLNKLKLTIVNDGRYHEIKGSEFGWLRVVGHHAEKSEIVFLHGKLPRYCGSDNAVVFSCDMRKEEMEFIAKSRWFMPNYTVLQPRVLLWPTLISSYAKLQGAYDGSLFTPKNNFILSTAS